MPTVTLRNIGRGHLFGATHENGQRFDTLIPIPAEGSALAGIMNYMVECAQAFIADREEASTKFIGDELKSRVQGLAVQRLATTYREAVKIGRQEGQGVAASQAMAVAVDPATPATAGLRAQAMAIWNGADGPGRIAMALDQNLPYEARAALVEHGVLSSLPEHVRATAIENYMIDRHISRTGSQSRFELKPDRNNPLLTGPDREAARRDAKTAIDNLNARSETVASVSNALSGIVNVVSLVTEMPADNVYQIFTTGKAA